ncbi:hypothetical protein [Cellulosimicrobium protaetiae]|uniref:Uncharacterized protein n=1 Tax=Cellulosimicrobium protaetiae TaxID=2587808 RepID=A0A6M5UDY4_9MICO|nr:hypothetical protein [Cellulosimicrobium protaetiae]QJW35423.1 hypothetical protein FIC82_003605 [Cellulosimicrobium protaetiae]
MTTGGDDGARPAVVRADAPGPSTVALVLRPFGYLTTGLVWTAIGLLLLALYAGVAVAQVVWGAGVPPVWEVDGRPVGWGVAALLVVVLAPLAGPAAWYLGCATWPLAALSWIYVVRALRPAFRREKLSRTTYALPGTTLGPMTATPVALSLQPVRASRATDVLMRFSARGWRPVGRDALATLPAGVGWAAATVACSPHLGAGARTALGVAALLLYGTTAVLLRRGWTRQSGAVAAPEQRPVVDLTADEIGARRAAVARARERRLRARGRSRER